MSSSSDSVAAVTLTGEASASSASKRTKLSVFLESLEREVLLNYLSDNTTKTNIPVIPGKPGDSGRLGLGYIVTIAKPKRGG